ncbi:unnamed protein product (macronuclear) [Paramecium tetraurelia]|uniref:Insertion element IS150 protein InsJ-like helix-turn-helix domain-containing protein n=1 Tax=Paramecium tetraurelia TaxID=5888 RepID=A0EED4_PARTE|nr:uncharacterized protein GSPATT00025997001 [Paramecium tetraurelia]CAK93652.1 unnamed protein product [Paramecium tetraurelia]|eukprot:XP_001461048.1 hypothetical protein (macronuclear) [Paramecium tetraurelia strain d4-2]
MEPQFDGSQTKKKYAVITPAVRMAFIKRVQSRQSTIKQAAQEFGIKFSTSKAILQTYKREGRVGKKKTRSRRSIFKNESKQEKQDEKQQPIDSKNEQKSLQIPQPMNQSQMSFQQLQAQQFQTLLLSLSMNPFLLLQNQYLQQSLLQTPTPQLFYYQQQLNSLRTQAQQQQFGKIPDSRQLITPVYSSKLLDTKSDEIGATLKDFN